MPGSTKKKKVRTPSRAKASPKKPSSKLPYGGPEDPELDAQGRIRQWQSASQDGNDLKVYVEYGCDENLTPALMKTKFPQFQKYNPSTFSSALQNCRKSMNSQIHNRRQVNCKSKEFFSIFIFISFLTNYINFYL